MPPPKESLDRKNALSEALPLPALGKTEGLRKKKDRQNT